MVVSAFPVLKKVLLEKMPEKQSEKVLLAAHD